MSQETEIKATFSVPPNIIFASMTDQLQICQFTRSLALSEPHLGGKLEMFGGSILGIYEEVEEDRKIKMKWKFKEWPTYADCVVDFVGVNDSCDVRVKLTNIPSHDEFG